MATTGLLAQDRTPRYAIADLGTLGGVSSEAAALNTLGDVVGSSTTADGAAHAFLYRNGRMLDLGTLTGGTASRATAIADNGAVAGYSGINAYGPLFREFTQAFAWQDGSMRALGALYCPCSFNARYGTSRALAVNNAGHIAGDSETDTGGPRTRAFLWQANVMSDLGADMDRAATSGAYGINDIDEVAGTIDGRAFLERGGVRQDLGVLPGDTASEARAINGKGQVAGSSIGANGISHAVLWDLGSTRSLGALPGDVASLAQAINVEGDVVGRSGAADFSQSRAVLWNNGSAIDLNSLVAGSGWTLSSATGLNSVRQVVGVGVHNGQVRAFLMSPQ